MNKIFPKRYGTFNCIENCIANICDPAKINSNPLFLYSWDFGYNLSQTFIEDRLHYRYSCSMAITNYIPLSEAYLNIKIMPVPLNIQEIKSRCFKGEAYIFEIDSYNCPWNLAYQKFHHMHHFLITCDPVNSHEKNLVVIDSFSTSDIIVFNEEILEHVKSVHLVEIIPCIDSESATKQKLRNEFTRFIVSNKEKGVYDLINCFINDLRLVESVDQLTQQATDISSSTMIRRLSYISNAKYNTASLMNYLSIDDGIIARMNALHDEWESIKNYFIKILLSKRVKLLKQASETLLLIVKEENDLAETVMESM
jgi:hypothetical protein